MYLTMTSLLRHNNNNLKKNLPYFKSNIYIRKIYFSIKLPVIKMHEQHMKKMYLLK